MLKVADDANLRRCDCGAVVHLDKTDFSKHPWHRARTLREISLSDWLRIKLGWL